LAELFRQYITTYAMSFDNAQEIHVYKKTLNTDERLDLL